MINAFLEIAINYYSIGQFPLSSEYFHQLSHPLLLKNFMINSLFCLFLEPGGTTQAGSGGNQSDDLSAVWAEDWLIILLYALASCAVLLLIFFCCFYICIYRPKQKAEEERGKIKDASFDANLPRLLLYKHVFLSFFCIFMQLKQSTT